MKLLFVLLCFEDHVLKNDYWHESHLCVGRDGANLPGTALPQKVLMFVFTAWPNQPLASPLKQASMRCVEVKKKQAKFWTIKWISAIDEVVIAFWPPEVKVFALIA